MDATFYRLTHALPVHNHMKATDASGRSGGMASRTRHQTFAVTTPIPIQPAQTGVTMNDYSHHHQNVPWYRNRGTLVLIGFIAVAGYFLLSEHQAHFIDFLPYLLLLACPLMHLFMHGGHGDHDRDNSKKG